MVCQSLLGGNARTGRSSARVLYMIGNTSGLVNILRMMGVPALQCGLFSVYHWINWDYKVHATVEVTRLGPAIDR